MAKALTGAREEVSENAPRITTISIPKDKIREVIGSGGKVIREITETTGAKIDIDDDGTIKVAAVDAKAAQAAIDWIRGIVAEPELGVIYTGKVVKVVDFGAFVNFLGARDGLVHISELAPQRVGKTVGRRQGRRPGQGQGARLRRSRQGQAQHEAGRSADRRGHPAQPSARREPANAGETPRRADRPESRSVRRRDARAVGCRPGRMAAVASSIPPSSAIAARRRGRRKTRWPGCAGRQALGCALGRIRRAADRRRRAGAVPRRTARPHDRSAAAGRPDAVATRSGNLDAGAWFGPAFAGEPVPTLDGGAGISRPNSASAPISRSRPSAGRDVATARRWPTIVSAAWPAAAAAAGVELSAARRSRRCATGAGDPARLAVRARAARLGGSRAERLGCASCIGADHRRLTRHGASPRSGQAGYPLAAYTVNDPARRAAVVRLGRDFRFLRRARYDVAGRRGRSVAWPTAISAAGCRAGA